MHQSPIQTGLSRRSGAIGGRDGLSLPLYSPAQDGKHIKCFPLRAELATNLTRPGPRWPQTCQKGTGLFWSVLSGNMPKVQLPTARKSDDYVEMSNPIASSTHQPFCYSRRGPRVKFIASSARAGEHLMCSPCEQDCRAVLLCNGLVLLKTYLLTVIMLAHRPRVSMSPYLFVRARYLTVTLMGLSSWCRTPRLCHHL